MDGKRTRPVQEQLALASVTMFLTANFSEKHEPLETKSLDLAPFDEDAFNALLGVNENHDEDRAGELILQVAEMKYFSTLLK
jgi:hypothetical protein